MSAKWSEIHQQLTDYRKIFLEIHWRNIHEIDDILNTSLQNPSAGFETIFSIDIFSSDLIEISKKSDR